eukprot:5573282-Pleurochrysis_carterae.AAC.7
MNVCVRGECSIGAERTQSRRRHLLVLADALLEKVCLSLERDELHPVKRVGGAVELGGAERVKEAVGHKLDVLRHGARVHSDQVDRQRVAHKLLLHGHRVADNLLRDKRRQGRVREGREG